MITGSCLCGNIKFASDDNISDASLCHCSICRKSTGSAFAAYGGVALENFKWVQGKNQLKVFSATSLLTKYFCTNCGSTLASTHQSWPEYIYISLGCLDEHAAINLEYHQFVASKANWETINDEIRQFDEWPEED